MREMKNLLKASPTAPNLCCSEAPAILLSFHVHVFLPCLVPGLRQEGAGEEEPGGEPGQTDKIFFIYFLIFFSFWGALVWGFQIFVELWL